MTVWRWSSLVVGVLLLLVIPLTRVSWGRNAALVTLVPLWRDDRDQTVPKCMVDEANRAVLQRIEEKLACNSDASHRDTQRARVLWLLGNCKLALDLWKRAAAAGDPTAAYELFHFGAYDLLSVDDRIVLSDYAYRMALHQRQASNEAAANAWLERAFDLRPQHRSAEQLARVYAAAGELARAEALWESMVDRLPETDAEYWYAMGVQHSQAGEWEQAGKAYERGAAIANDPFQYWIEAGRAWEQAANWSQANEVYERVRQAHPELIWGYMGLGNVERLQKQYQAALMWYQRAQQVQPSYSDTHFYSGWARYLLDDYDGAQTDLVQALALNPEHVSASYLLAQTLYKKGDVAQAALQLENSIRLAEVAPVSWWEQLGDWRVEQRLCAAARTAYERAKTLASDKRSIDSKLGALSAACGGR